MPLRRALVVLSLVLAAIGCRPEPKPVVSAWSEPLDGLQMRITAAARFRVGKNGWVELAARYEIRNAGKQPIQIVPLSRLYLTNEAGVTKGCLREEDVADMTIAPATIAPGESGAWTQDGRIKTPPGPYRLHALLDGPRRLRSPAVPILIAD